MQRQPHIYSFQAVVLTVSMLFTVTNSANDVVKLPNYSMKLSVGTAVSRETIWNLWVDVENWKLFDERLKYSYLVAGDEFKEGAVGYLKGKGAPKTKFELIKVEQGVSFAEVLTLPLYQSVHLKRYFEPSVNSETIFTHEVQFKGSLRGIYHALFAGAFKKDLKLVMQKMKQLAEKKNLKKR